MKKFIVGLVLGLALSSVPTVAEWDFSDYEVLKQVRNNVAQITMDISNIRKNSDRATVAIEWQARSLQRMVWVMERQFPAPPEKAKP